MGGTMFLVGLVAAFALGAWTGHQEAMHHLHEFAEALGWTIVESDDDAEG